MVIGSGFDSDLDGLGALAEYVLGLDDENADSDSDGILDGAEVDQGLNPLDGIGYPTGIIASLPLMGTANEVTLTGSLLDAGGQTAYIATGSHGLAIVDASRFDNPIVLGQLDLPGTAVDVAASVALKIAVVATGTDGLHFVNVADPQMPTIIRTININASQVELLDGVAFVAVGAELRAYDMLTGERHQVLNLGGSTITGIAREGSMLYTMDQSRRLRVVDRSGFEMTLRGSLVMPQGGGKLFVGGGIAYVAALPSYFRGGFGTADVTNPDAPTLISGSDVVSPFVGPGTHVVANGSGLGVLIGSPNGSTHRLQVVNLIDPSATNSVITFYDLPAQPRSVHLGGGVAYVADGTAGLQVVNYIAFDSQGQPPTINFDPNTIDFDSDTPGIQVQEGSVLRLNVGVVDDVQVRNVQVLLNGNVVYNDVAFPWDLPVKFPSIAAGGTQATLQLRATDSGGNVTLSSVLNIQLVLDTFAPTIIGVTPTDGALRGSSARTVRIGFSESMDPATLSSANIRVIGSLNPGVPLTPVDIQIRSDGREVQFAFDSLPPDDYQIIVKYSRGHRRVEQRDRRPGLCQRFPHGAGHRHLERAGWRTLDHGHQLAGWRRAHRGG